MAARRTPGAVNLPSVTEQVHQRFRVTAHTCKGGLYYLFVFFLSFPEIVARRMLISCLSDPVLLIEVHISIAFWDNDKQEWCLSYTII